MLIVVDRQKNNPPKSSPAVAEYFHERVLTNQAGAFGPRDIRKRKISLLKHLSANRCQFRSAVRAKFLSKQKAHLSASVLSLVNSEPHVASLRDRRRRPEGTKSLTIGFPGIRGFWI